ncbi:hypothetical protein [Enterococcus sp. ZJ1622]|uniref:hypothetical protein n=1 Tax=Enterococcus sp. ZJ1622 TaxID=2709401 RepID=UPI0013EC4820|nr:hypothetical protein [Enterococcus sp. ZJ1622]
MLVKELINHLEKMDENSTIKLEVKTKAADNEEIPTYADIQSIEFGENRVVLKGDDELIEWD